MKRTFAAEGLLRKSPDKILAKIAISRPREVGDIERVGIVDDTCSRRCSGRRSRLGGLRLCEELNLRTVLLAEDAAQRAFLALFLIILLSFLFVFFLVLLWGNVGLFGAVHPRTARAGLRQALFMQEVATRWNASTN